MAFSSLRDPVETLDRAGGAQARSPAGGHRARDHRAGNREMKLPPAGGKARLIESRLVNGRSESISRRGSTADGLLETNGHEHGRGLGRCRRAAELGRAGRRPSRRPASAKP